MKLPLTPWITAAMTITTSTPIVTPRMVRPLRTLFARSADSAMRIPSSSAVRQFTLRFPSAIRDPSEPTLGWTRRPTGPDYS